MCVCGGGGRGLRFVVNCIDLIIEFYARIFHCSSEIIKSRQYAFIYVNFLLLLLACSRKLYTLKYQLKSV